MSDLVIEYVLDGKRPGYNFTTPTTSLSDSTRKAIWQQAMPRGQGWRRYIGAQSLKCFPVESDRRVAISEVTVTNQVDEGGRQGIRRAEIKLISAADFLDYLTLRLTMLPESVRAEADRKLSWWRWKRIMDRATPKVRQKKGQIILAAPYTSPRNWQLMEAVVLLVATSQRLRALKGWPAVHPLTTLALDPREESTLVALPANQVARLNGVKAISLG